jgi:amyloid beta precursor protein binding protein 1
VYSSGFDHNLVVFFAGQMQENSLLKLDEICRQQNVMLIIARSYGLAGLLRISVEVLTCSLNSLET